MLKKAVIVVILGILISMSVIPSSGNLVSEKGEEMIEQKTEEISVFSETCSIYGLNIETFQTLKHTENMFLSAAINFPLPGEVFRVGDEVVIDGTASDPDFQDFVLEWGIGLNPTDWFTDGISLSNNGTVEIVNDTLGLWDTSVVTEAEFYTIQLTVNLMGSGQYDANVSIYLDPTLHPNFPFGWPHEIPGSQVAIWSPIALSDINNDGYQEIGFGTVTVVPAGDNNKDYVIDHTGTLVQGWPKQIYGIQGASLTFADIDSSTTNEEVIGGMWGDKLFVWHDDGSNVDGWPKNIYVSRASATVNDIDGDGDLEIILPTTDGGGLVYAFHHDATLVDGWPVYIGSPVRRAASTADIDNDGFAEIFFGDQNGKVYALHHDGTTVNGWPQQAHDFIKCSPVIADIEGDGDLEILICSGFTEQRIISIWHHDGTMADGWPQENGLCFAQPSVADIDKDGDLEILVGGAITGTSYTRFYVWHHDGSTASGFPIIFPYDPTTDADYIHAQPVVGDIDGDSDVEIIVGSYGDKLYAWHHDGTDVSDWPKIIGDSVDSTAALGDIDNDNLVEVVVAGDDGKIYVWDMGSEYNVSNIEWPMFQFDTHHTGHYTTGSEDNNPPEAPEIDGPTSGKAGTSYDYTFVATDPDNDDLTYIVDWGDDSPVELYGPAPSGTEVSANHTWSDKNTYTVGVKARDSFGAESDTTYLEVTMPVNLQILNFPLLQKILERFPHDFPLLQLFLGLFD